MRDSGQTGVCPRQDLHGFAVHFRRSESRESAFLNPTSVDELDLGKSSGPGDSKKSPGGFRIPFFHIFCYISLIVGVVQW